MNWKATELDNLIAALLSLETPDETRRFLRDLLTEGELLEFAKRLQAADLLQQNVPYASIIAKTGFSSTTVARVSKWLNGDLGGYRMVLAKLHHHSAQQPRRALPL